MNNNYDELLKEIRGYFKVYISEFLKTPQDLLELENKDKPKVRCFLPDHDDRDPSMIINDTSAYCFKCGNIDIFKAAHLLEDKPISGEGFLEENVFYLADKFGVDVSGFRENGNRDIIEKNKIRFFFSTMEEYLKKSLKFTHVKEYISKRKIKEIFAESYGVGGVRSFEHFGAYMHSKGINVEEFRVIGVSAESINENKLIFIIRDEYGNPCSFASREMKFEESEAKKRLMKFYPEHELAKVRKRHLGNMAFQDERISNDDRAFIKRSIATPKYINGSESIAYKKKQLLYGLDMTQRSRKVNDIFSTIYAVEGYMDTLSASQNKNFNVVSYNSGTLSDEQIKLLRKLKYKNIVWLPDNDYTGRTKILGFIEKSKNEDLTNIKIGIFKDKSVKDTDEACLKYPGVRMEDLVDIFDIFEIQAKFLIEEQIENKQLDLTYIIKEVSKSIGSVMEPANRVEATKNFHNLLKHYEINDDMIWDFKNIINQVEFCHNFDRDTLAKDLSKDLAEAKILVEKDPYNAIGILENTLGRVKAKENKVLTQRKNIKEDVLDSIDSYEELKKEEVEPIKFGITVLDDLRIKTPTNFVILGKPNTGKTITKVFMAVNILKASNSSSVIYFSKDDTFNKVMDLFVSCVGHLSRSFVDDPYHHPLYGIYKARDKDKAIMQEKKYQLAKEQIKKWVKSGRLLITGLDKRFSTVADFESVLKEHSSDDFVKKSLKVVFVDSSSKLSSGLNNVKEMAYVSRNVKEICASYGYTAFQNYEVTKHGSRRGQRVDTGDLADAKEIEFDADVILRLTQPVHDLDSSGESVANSVWFKQIGEIKKPEPILVMDITKNKVSGSKYGEYFFKLDAEFTEITEINKKRDEDEYKKAKQQFREDLNKYNKKVKEGA